MPLWRFFSTSLLWPKILWLIPNGGVSCLNCENMVFFTIGSCCRLRGELSIVWRRRLFLLRQSLMVAGIWNNFCWKESAGCSTSERALYHAVAPRVRHPAISRELLAEFTRHLRGNKPPCQLLAAPFDVLLPEASDDPVETVMPPDLSVICDGAMLDDVGCRGAAYLATFGAGVVVYETTVLSSDYYAVPEPSTFLLLGGGLAGMVGLRLRRRNR